MILVTGAMGRVGTAAVTALQQKGVPTRALVPNKRRVPWLAEGGAELFEGDCDVPERLEQALDGVSAVVLLSRPSADQVEVQRTVIDACAAHGIDRVVKLSVAGASEAARAEAARSHWHAERQLLDTVSEPVIVRAGRTMQDLLYQSPLLLAHHMLVGCQGNGLAADVDARDIGAVLAGLATTSDLPEAPLLVTGPTAFSRQEVTALLSQAMGVTLRYVPCTPLELEQVLSGAHISRWQVEDLVSYEEAAAEGQWQAVTDVVPRWTTFPARSFPAFAHELAMSLRSHHFLPSLRATVTNAQMADVAVADT